jgi:hypothetical protein
MSSSRASSRSVGKTASTSSTTLRTASPREQRHHSRELKKSSESRLNLEKNKKQRNLGFEESISESRATDDTNIAVNGDTANQISSVTTNHFAKTKNFVATSNDQHIRNSKITGHNEKDDNYSDGTRSSESDGDNMDVDYRPNGKKNYEDDEDLLDDELDDDDLDCVPENDKMQKHYFRGVQRIIAEGHKPTSRKDKRMSIGDSTLSSRTASTRKSNNDKSESQTITDTRRLEARMLTKKNTCYQKLTDNEILQIGWYVRDNLFRRVKIMSDNMMKSIIEDLAKIMDSTEMVWIEKYGDVKVCVKSTLNYRRAYVTKKIRVILRGT